MVRMVELVIEDAKALAVMHDDTYPKACDTIWNRLPIEGMALMAKWACREIMLHLTGDQYFELEPETPLIRDFSSTSPYILTKEQREAALHAEIYRGLRSRPHLGYFLRGPTLYGAQKEYDPEFRLKLCEITIYYGLTTGLPGDPGRDMDSDKWEVKPKIPTVSIPWATFIPPIPRDFYLKCESVRHGRKKLTIRKYEE
jgi:hypothetical protein